MPFDIAAQCADKAATAPAKRAQHPSTPLNNSPAYAGRATQSDLTPIPAGFAVTDGEYHGPKTPAAKKEEAEKAEKKNPPRPKPVEPSITIPAPWERLGLTPDDSLAIKAVVGAITAATETPTYGAAMSDFVDANRRIKDRMHADGYMRHELAHHEGWRHFHQIAQNTEGGDDAEPRAEAEFDVTRQIWYHLKIVATRTEPQKVKPAEPQSPSDPEEARLEDRTYVAPEMGAMCESDLGQDASDMGQWARNVGHRQLSLAAIGAAMRETRPWFTLDVFACHMFGLATAPELAKRIGRNPDAVRGQLIAAYSRIARARRQMAHGNENVKEVVRWMAGGMTQTSNRSRAHAPSLAFDKADVREILIGKAAPRQIYLGNEADVAAGLKALQAPCPMLTAYRHSAAPDAASVLAERRVVADDVIAARSATPTDRSQNRVITGGATDRDAVAAACAWWEDDQRKKHPEPWKGDNGIPAALDVGRTFRHGESDELLREQAEREANAVEITRKKRNQQKGKRATSLRSPPKQAR
jgi:hypothetical protein